jgi:hypothetical protein
MSVRGNEITRSGGVEPTGATVDGRVGRHGESPARRHAPAFDVAETAPVMS